MVEQHRRSTSPLRDRLSGYQHSRAVGAGLAARLCQSLLDDLQSGAGIGRQGPRRREGDGDRLCRRSEEHTSELQSLMRISYADFRLQKKTTIIAHNQKATITHKL